MRVSQKAFNFYKANIASFKDVNAKMFNKLVPLPMAIGSYYELRKITGMSARHMNYVLTVWSNRAEYLMSMVAFNCRHDLDGGTHLLTDEHYQRAYSIVKHNISHKRIKKFIKNFEKAYGYIPETLSDIIAE